MEYIPEHSRSRAAREEQVKKHFSTPIEEVLALFPYRKPVYGTDFPVYPDPGRPAFFGEGTKHERPHTPDYHVDSRFSPEQMPYIDGCEELLYRLALGTRYLSGDLKESQNVPSFLDRLTNLTELDQASSMRTFHDPTLPYIKKPYWGKVLEATLLLLDDFAAYYPNWTPVLRDMLHKNGADGFILAFRAIQFSLMDKLAFDKIQLAKPTFIARHGAHGGILSNEQGGEAHTEGQCPAPELGEHVILTAREIAERKGSQIRTRYPQSIQIAREQPRETHYLSQSNANEIWQTLINRMSTSMEKALAKQGYNTDGSPRKGLRLLPWK